MYFEWDDSQAESNFLKYGLTLGEAVTVFADPYLLFTEDFNHSFKKKEKGQLEKRKMAL
jgi:uncharacterized protein